jgi:hypothetical protein
MNFRVLLLFLLTNTFFVVAQNDSNINNQNKTEHSKNYQSITFNGIWCWFSDPRAVYFEGKHKRTYTGWVDNYGDIHIAYFDHETKIINSKVVYDNLEIDDHNNPSILIDKKGHLIVFFNAHSQDGKPLYMIKSSAPETIDNWNRVKELFLNDTTYYKNAKILNHTYTNPIRLSAENGKIFLFWRGINNKPTYATSIDNGDTWSSGRILFMPNEDTTIRVPYTKVYSDGVSKIHFTFTDGHPTKAASNALYYMYYEAGSFYKANGEKVKNIEQLPINQQEIDLVYKQNSENYRVWNWDIAQDKNGDPIIVYAKFPDNENHIYSYAIWKNNTWYNYDLINSGNWFPDMANGSNKALVNYSGGIAIDHNSPNILYLSVKKDVFFEIEKWVTNNKGETWDIEKVTNNSTKNNIRPFVVRDSKKENNPNLLWIQNTIYKHYSLVSKDKKSILNFNDRYHTAIKMNIEYPKIEKQITKQSLMNTTRELLDWQLENPTYNLNKVNYKYGLFYDGIKAFCSLTNENRYKNELDNKFQYEEEEENESLILRDLIWYYNNNDRLYTNRINAITTNDIKELQKDIRLVTLSKLLSQINEDDNIEKVKLKKLHLDYLEELITVKLDSKDSNKLYSNALSVYNIAKGINDGEIPLSLKSKIIKSWLSISQQLIKNKHNNKQFDIGIIGAFLLASKEIYKLLDK